MNQGAPDIKTTDICDRFSSRVEVCAPILTSYGGATAFNGPISTVEVYEDNVLVREALEDLAAGAVLVVDGGGSGRCALLGDKLASIAASRGLKGVIVAREMLHARELRWRNVDPWPVRLRRRRRRHRGSRNATCRHVETFRALDANRVYPGFRTILMAPSRLCWKISYP